LKVIVSISEQASLNRWSCCARVDCLFIGLAVVRLSNLYILLFIPSHITNRCSIYELFDYWSVIKLGVMPDAFPYYGVNSLFFRSKITWIL